MVLIMPVTSIRQYLACTFGTVSVHGKYGSLDERASSFDIGHELAKEAILVVNIAVLCYTSEVNVL